MFRLVTTGRLINIIKGESEYRVGCVQNINFTHLVMIMMFHIEYNGWSTSLI